MDSNCRYFYQLLNKDGTKGDLVETAEPMHSLKVRIPKDISSMIRDNDLPYDVIEGTIKDFETYEIERVILITLRER